MGRLDYFTCMVYEGYREKVSILRSRWAFVDNAYESLSRYAMYDSKDSATRRVLTETRQ